MKPRDMSRQSGATTVEFALVLIIFLTFLLAITDFSRMLFTWNAANEATRAGARYAVVCDDTANKAAGARQDAGAAAADQRHQPRVEATRHSCTPVDLRGRHRDDHRPQLPVDLADRGRSRRWRRFPCPRSRPFLTREIMRQDPNSARHLL